MSPPYLFKLSDHKNQKLWAKRFFLRYIQFMTTYPIRPSSIWSVDLVSKNVLSSSRIINLVSWPQPCFGFFFLLEQLFLSLELSRRRRQTRWMNVAEEGDILFTYWNHCNMEIIRFDYFIKLKSKYRYRQLSLASPLPFLFSGKRWRFKYRISRIF